jgi:uncharacterized membrane protein
MVLMLLCWGLIIAGIILVVQWVIAHGRPGGASAPGGESAVDILKKRYVRSDISKEEYERMKQDLAELSPQGEASCTERFPSSGWS